MQPCSLLQLHCLPCSSIPLRLCNISSPLQTSPTTPPPPPISRQSASHIPTTLTRKPCTLRGMQSSSTQHRSNLCQHVWGVAPSRPRHKQPARAPACAPQVVWVDLLTRREFEQGFGSHTPMFSGQTKCVRYFMNFKRALQLHKQVRREGGAGDQGGSVWECAVWECSVRECAV